MHLFLSRKIDIVPKMIHWITNLKLKYVMLNNIMAVIKRFIKDHLNFNIRKLVLRQTKVLPLTASCRPGNLNNCKKLPTNYSQDPL